VARGLRRAREFTWDRVARSFLSVYQEVAGGGPEGSTLPLPPLARLRAAGVITIVNARGLC